MKMSDKDEEKESATRELAAVITDYAEVYWDNCVENLMPKVEEAVEKYEELLGKWRRLK